MKLSYSNWWRIYSAWPIKIKFDQLRNNGAVLKRDVILFHVHSESWLSIELLILPMYWHYSHNIPLVCPIKFIALSWFLFSSGADIATYQSWSISSIHGFLIFYILLGFKPDCYLYAIANHLSNYGPKCASSYILSSRPNLCNIFLQKNHSTTYHIKYEKKILETSDPYNWNYHFVFLFWSDRGLYMNHIQMMNVCW